MRQEIFLRSALKVNEVTVPPIWHPLYKTQAVLEIWQRRLGQRENRLQQYFQVLHYDVSNVSISDFLIKRHFLIKSQ